MEMQNQTAQNQTTQTPVAVALRFGLLLAVAWVLVDFLIRVVGLGFMSYGIVTVAASLLVSVTAVVLAHRAFRAGNGGLMSFGQGVLIAGLMLLLSGLVSGVFNWLYVTYIDPAFVDNMKEQLVAFMEQNNVPDEDIAKSAAKFDEMKAGLGKSLVSALTSGLVGGLVLGSIVSIFTKRNRPDFE